MKNCSAVIQMVACLIVILGIMGGSHGNENGGIVVLAAEQTPTLTPAPAPAPVFANLTALLSLAGPFKTFLSLLEASSLLTVLQAQANNTEQGITIFAPSNTAFSSLPKKLLANLTADEKKELLLAHCISKFYTLTDFQDFNNPADTMATGSNGGKYNLNITGDGGAVTLSSGYVTTPIISTVHVTDPLALYTVGKVLLPEDIFGLPSPSPAPAPSPEADSPSPSGTTASPSSSGNTSSATHSAASFVGPQQSIYVIVGIAAGALLLLPRA